jgi:hypothetical protein
MIKYAPKIGIVKSKYYSYVYISQRVAVFLYHLILTHRLFTEDRSLTEYGVSLLKIESQNRVTPVK